MTSRCFIWTTFLVEGFHHAPEELRLAEGYLSHVHRHLFHFTVKMEVGHLDREVEFIQFKRLLRQRYPEPFDFKTSSCEMIAQELAAFLMREYAIRSALVEVSEDQESGALVVVER